MKKKRMQVISLALAALLCLGLFAGCSGGSEDTTAPTDSTAPATDTPETETPETETPATETPAEEELQYSIAEVTAVSDTGITVKLYTAPEGTVVDKNTYSADGLTLGEETATLVLGNDVTVQMMEGDTPVSALEAQVTVGSLVRLGQTADGQLQELLILLSAQEPAVEDSGTSTAA